MILRDCYALDDHVKECHMERRKVWVCKDLTGPPYYHIKCAACTRGLSFNANYNAGTHIRRVHFGLDRRAERNNSNNTRHRNRDRGLTMDELKTMMYRGTEYRVHGSDHWWRPDGNRNDPDLSMSPQQCLVSHPVYHTLHIAKTSRIRILTLLPAISSSEQLCGTLSLALAADTADYEALSYTWGLAGQSQTIVIDGHSFSIQPNLHHALLDLRRLKEPRRLWVDAICIDQANIAEKGEQVSAMASIYSKASRVVVWLNSVDHSTMAALREFKDLVSGPMHLSPEFRAALQALCEDEYWTRIWIVQELVVARAISILYGDAEIAWSIFEQAVLAVSSDSFSINSLDRFRQVARHRREYAEGMSTIVLETLIYRYQDSASTETRDRIYGLLGIVNYHEARQLPADYSIDCTSLLLKVFHICRLSCRNPCKLVVALMRVLEVGPEDLQNTQDIEMRSITRLLAAKQRHLRSTDKAD